MKMDLHILKGLVRPFLDLRILKGLADFAEYFNEYHTMWLSFVKAFFQKSAGLVDWRLATWRQELRMRITVVPDAGGADKVCVFAQRSQRQFRLFPRHKPASLRDHAAQILELHALHHASAQHNHVRHKQSD